MSKMSIKCCSSSLKTPFLITSAMSFQPVKTYKESIIILYFIMLQLKWSTLNKANLLLRIGSRMAL